jgi:hypothetical protein
MDGAGERRSVGVGEKLVKDSRRSRVVHGGRIGRRRQGRMHMRTKFASVALAAKPSGALMCEETFRIACEAVGDDGTGSAGDLVTELLNESRRKSVGVAEAARFPVRGDELVAFSRCA